MNTTSRIALITGANRGIGRATALELARNGIDIVLTYNSHREEADAVVRSITELGRSAVALQLDVGKVASFGAFVEALDDALRRTWKRSTLDILINNAGLQIAQPLTEVTEEAFDRLVDVHFKGVFFLTQKLLPLLSDMASIVNISTGGTRFYNPDRAVYGAVKGAVEVMTRYLAHDLGRRGITVNAIAPGAVATDFSGGLLRDTEHVQQHIASMTPLGRHAVADDIAGAIVALLGSGNRFVTGQRIEVSGGIHL
ncbi:SDR family oxidoreductase [Pendulispora brunnea]|uniref:SDR family oxidoreductase n=1 Tax=Pendulispora brunnea TaxID=2905690 RepID=A0ABZ2K0R2_9BACT